MHHPYCKTHGKIYMSVSPYEQKAIPIDLKVQIPNIVRRLRQNLCYPIIPLYACYQICKWSKEENKRLSRKNPADYANDK